MNRIELNFNLCTPAPSGGYNIQYRVQGSGDEYINAGNFFISPAVFYDNINPAGTCYEGFISSVCGSVLGDAVNWQGCDSGVLIDTILSFTVIEGDDPAISAVFTTAVDVPLIIDSVFVNGYSEVGCTGEIEAHMHSTNETIPAGNSSYVGADFDTGPWTGIVSHLFYDIVLSWPGNENIPVSNGAVVTMGSYAVSIFIDGC